MTEQQRTDLLNYLNNNKITYLFNKEDEAIVVDIKVKQ